MDLTYTGEDLAFQNEVRAFLKENLTAEIKTGKRRVIDYLLSPVQRRVGESMRER